MLATITGAMLALPLMQAAALPTPQFTDVAKADDGTAYAVDFTTVNDRIADGAPLRTASVRLSYSAAANAERAQSTRTYRIRCAARTAGLLSAIHTARATGRVSMDRTGLADLEYIAFDALPAAEQTALQRVCEASL